MKKTLAALILTLFMTIPAMAAWTTAIAPCSNSPYSLGDGVYLYCYEISATSDASSSGDLLLSTLLNTEYGADAKDKMMSELAGTLLYWVDYVPDDTDTPTTASTITIDKETGFLIFTATVATAANDEGWSGDQNVAALAPITDVTVAMTTLANTKKAIVRLWFYGGRK